MADVFSPHCCYFSMAAKSGVHVLAALITRIKDDSIII